jgi:hypothetical protein
MRTVIALSFLALLLTAGVTAFGAETVSVGGDYGAAWLANQPERISTDNGGGLWTWGGTPSGMKVLNGSLAPEEDDEEIDYDDIGWLGTEFKGTPIRLNQSAGTGTADFLYPFYSADPWFLSQHYEMPILIPADYYD